MSSDDNWDDWPLSPGGSDGPNIQDEINVRERVGMPGHLFGTLPQNRVERAMMDPLERFRQYVEAIGLNLVGYNINISNENIQYMLDVAGKLDAVGYKNPTAYVLGFLATGGGQRLDKKKIEDAIGILPLVKDKSVLPPDIIRYARLWQGLRKKLK